VPIAVGRSHATLASITMSQLLSNWRRGNPLSAWLVGCALALAPGVSFAQDANSAAAAEALFSQARSLQAEGKYAEACPKFAESQRLDPGTGTLLNLASCYEKADQLASAWTTWIEAARSAKSAGQTDRETLARQGAAALEPRLGKLTLQVQADPPPGLMVKRNGVELLPATWGTPLPVDKGTYRIEASAPGYRTAVMTATVENGQSHSVVVPRLVPGSASAQAPTAPPASETSAKNPTGAAAPAATNPAGQTQRTLGIVGLTVGGVALGAGGVFGILALSKFNESKAQCSPTDINDCNADGVSLRNQALTFGNVSTVAFIAGGVLAAGGVVLLVTAPSAKSEVAILPSAGGLFVNYGAKF
jgi:hypothetical protein